MKIHIPYYRHQNKNQDDVTYIKYFRAFFFQTEPIIDKIVGENKIIQTYTRKLIHPCMSII